MEYHNISLDEPNLSLQTALHIAALNNKLEVCITLVNRGCNPLLRDNNYKTPAEIAEMHNFFELKNYMIVVERVLNCGFEMIF